MLGLYDVKAQTIQSNELRKHIEYNVEDSAVFFKSFPNGLYGIYNDAGQLVEKNAFSHGQMIHEFKILYLYDDKGRNFMWMYYDTMFVEKITRVRIEEYDSLGNNYGYKDFSSGLYASAYETRLYDEYKNPERRKTTDSIISENQKIYIKHFALNPSDTISVTTEYYSNSVIDSSIEIFPDPKIETQIIHRYTYYTNTNQIQSKTRLHYIKGRLENKIVTEYKPNGLPKDRYYHEMNSGKESIIHTRFIYFYK